MPATKTRPRASSSKSKEKGSVYSVHPSLQYIQNVIANMKAKTGRTIEEWIDFVNKSGPKTEEARRDWLKKEHKLGTNYAWWIAERSVGKGEEDASPEAYLKQANDWVQEMFAGKKEALRPLYEKLLTIGLSLGPDVKACPCKTMVPLYRENVFAQLKPTTNTRLDLGLYLRSVKGKLPAHVAPTGGLEKGDRITHRIAISSPDDIDDEAKKWMKTAYDLAKPE